MWCIYYIKRSNIRGQLQELSCCERDKVKLFKSDKKEGEMASRIMNDDQYNEIWLY